MAPTAGSLLYTYENLTKDDLRFYRQLPTHAVLFFHGAPPLTIGARLRRGNARVVTART